MTADDRVPPPLLKGTIADGPFSTARDPRSAPFLFEDGTVLHSRSGLNTYTQV